MPEGQVIASEDENGVPEMQLLTKVEPEYLLREVPRQDGQPVHIHVPWTRYDQWSFTKDFPNLVGSS